MAAQNGILIPNEVLSDISDFVRVNEVKNLTFVSRTFSAVTAKRLSIINALYTQSTEQLIKTFISTRRQQDLPSRDQSIGEVNVQIELSNCPGTEKQKIAVKVLSVNHLKWQMSENVWRKAFKPWVKVNWIGPYLAVNQRTSLSQAQRTAVTVMTTELNTDEVWAPEFNKPFHFFIDNERELVNHELFFEVMQPLSIGNVKTVGLGVFKLSQLAKQGSYTCSVQLSHRLYINDTGLLILRILSRREYDMIAIYFAYLICNDETFKRNLCYRGPLPEHFYITYELNPKFVRNPRKWLSTYCATPYCATVHIVPLPIVPPDNCATGLLCHRTVVPPLKYRGN
ncbi:phorbol ester/diacylglycerol-binding protein unc-13 [Ditylenchus destructor]|uniref:Phorbol ester/diacylglycerol-binding protein unc-13 n=1 Tax=Ditylenchus destructor TaxID=166010 RepID=A0AAD4MU12_9BILA|nr:phorbol ester/diacylglycerol-binding protein unc-13 [Ditylenchus destructor]